MYKDVSKASANPTKQLILKIKIKIKIKIKNKNILLTINVSKIHKLYNNII
jgi:hypothetical protein